jgi:hypothetical protein
MKHVSVDIVRVDEPWAKAFLPDGTVIKVKLVFSHITRIFNDDGTPAYESDGTPIYFAKHTSVGAIEAPEASMRKEPVK